MFLSARLKLTAWYLTIIMLVSTTFSAAIYHVLTREIQRFERMNRFRIEHRIGRVTAPLIVNEELIEETKRRVLTVLVLINGGIFISAGGFGYILAGRTLSPIQQMVEEQRRFISDASHELRTPLTSLKSAFEVYLRGKNPTASEAQDLARESITEVNKLQSLSESLLHLIEGTQSNGKPTMQPVSLAHVAREAIREITPIAKRSHITIDKTVRDCRVQGDADSLARLLVILLDNAVKYSPHGSTVKIGIKKADGNTQIAISDNGTGIKKEDLPHIFDRFYRADTARTKTGANGYGLGLSIAKKIIDEHRGTIRIKSKEGKGSTFTVELPTSV